MTAHPTEARRRTTLNKLARDLRAPARAGRAPPVPGERRTSRRRIAAAIQELWGTDELRAVSTDGPRRGHAPGSSTSPRRSADVVPAIYRDLEAAVRECYPDDDIVVPPLLTFGSWMGGDRDGNPNVTPDMTATALELMKEACLPHLQGAILELSGASRCPRASPASEPEELSDLLARVRGATSPGSPPSRASATPRSPTGGCSS